MKILPFILIAFIVACGSDSSTDETNDQDETVADTSAVDSLVVEGSQFDSTIHNGLRDLFSEEMCVRIRRMNSLYNNYSRNEEFEDLLDTIDILQEDMHGDLSRHKTLLKSEMPEEFGGPAVMDLMAAVDEYADSILPIKIDCGAECVDVEFFIDTKALEEPTKFTPSEADDKLAEILHRVYGANANFYWVDDTGFKEWWSDEEFQYTFGNYYMSQTFGLIHNFEQAFPDQFVERVAGIKEQLLDRLEIHEGGKTVNSQWMILDEFQTIYHLGVLNEKQKEQLQKSIDFIETSESIQFEYSGY